MENLKYKIQHKHEEYIKLDYQVQVSYSYTEQSFGWSIPTFESQQYKKNGVLKIHHCDMYEEEQFDYIKNEVQWK